MEVRYAVDKGRGKRTLVQLTKWKYTRMRGQSSNSKIDDVEKISQTNKFYQK